MKLLTKILALGLLSSVLVACSKNNDNPVANSITLHFSNTFKQTPIVLGDATSNTATLNTSAEGQLHHFSELKYVISNIRLVGVDGKEFPYFINDLDKGATVVNQANPQSLDFVLSSIPVGEYKQLKFGLGVKQALNTLDQVRFPKFYAEAGANNTEMMWEWGTGYRFTKIEGFYEAERKQLSIHTGSTVDEDEAGLPIQGVDAYRDVTLELSTRASVGRTAPKITIVADFDKLLSGKSHTIKLIAGKGSNSNATPNVHTAVEMLKFVDNLGGDGKSDLSGMFSIQRVEN